jgi:hypothetical protein
VLVQLIQYLLKKCNVFIATQAINGSSNSNITHLDPKQNNSQDILLALKKVQQTGKTEDLIYLTGIPHLLSNDINQ